MSKHVTYFPRTTVQQRYLLFATWEATGSVKKACHKAHVSKRVFYLWKSRFETGGSPALARAQSHAPKHPRKISADVSERVLAMKRAHPRWGKRRIADELAKEQSWVRVVSPNTVKRILKEANLWPEPTRSEKKSVFELCPNRRAPRPEFQY
jgi:transposase